MIEYPEHLAESQRAWKQLKRKEMRALMNSKQLDDLICGCYYTPCHDELSSALDLLHKAQEKMRVSQWGR